MGGRSGTTALASGSRKPARPAGTSASIEVTLAHGNLAFARYPVAVGHYLGDAIVSAEAYLDGLLGGALRSRHRVGRYPGLLTADEATSEVFLNPKLAADPAITPQGAIVIGLGTVGNLTAGALTRASAEALLEYSLEWDQWTERVAAGASERRSAALGVSFVLIGTGAGGMPVGDAVYAILQAVARANEKLAAPRGLGGSRIRFLELIELWEDRALQAARALGRLAKDPGMRGVFTYEGRLQSRRGGLRRASFEEPGGWWHRLQILASGTAGGLRFTASTRRARSEVRLLDTQRALVDDFIERSIATTHDNRTIARTLFELLLPNGIKDEAPDRDDVVLLLDEEAAAYPWELLEDRRGGGKPLAVDHGILRQLESLEFREAVRGAVEDAALVIGDPESDLPELEGAQVEAKDVARALERGGFEVEKRIRPSAQSLTHAVFSRGYRVVHVAGHGVYGEPATGIVIGAGIVLSPAVLRQLREVPELVFVNCCHLGRIEGARRGRIEVNRIAANVATELIRMGVRAVIAAGWAVDDRAASLFATSFYDGMLAGTGFGRAVLAARRATYERHPDTNTWGAYQCYGDPEYRLRRDGDAVAQVGSIDFVAASDAACEIENLAARLSLASGAEAKGDVTRLVKIATVLRAKPWLLDGRVRAALGRAHAAAGRFADALAAYRLAWKADDGAVSFHDVDQLARLERVSAGAKGRKDSARDTVAALAAAIARLQAAAGAKKSESGTRRTTSRRSTRK